MTLDEAVFIANRMAQVLSDSALILDKMDAQSGAMDAGAGGAACASSGHCELRHRNS